MSVTVVVGGQYGSEGKGKAVSLIARQAGEATSVVRCGGPNSGHTVVEHGRRYSFRLLPAGCVYGREGFIAPAAIIDLGVLRSEIEGYGIQPGRLSVDPYSVVITPDMRLQETTLIERISSTGSGAGAALAAKTLRGPDVRLVRDVLSDHAWLRPFVRDVRSELQDRLSRGHRVILEGTQGFGLSLHHSRMFPQTTSRDTTAGQFVMEAGVSPLQVDQVVLVVRTFPIRVAGANAGPLRNEITWNELADECGSTEALREFTTVTKKLRRVARFDMGLVRDACSVNQPTSLVVHGLDYLGWENRDVGSFFGLNQAAQAFLWRLQTDTGVKVAMAFTGPSNDSAVFDIPNAPEAMLVRFDQALH